MLGLDMTAVSAGLFKTSVFGLRPGIYLYIIRAFFSIVAKVRCVYYKI